MMKIAFIGLGSIAKRHIRNLNVVLQKRDIEFQIDVYRHGSLDVEDESLLRLIHRIYNDKDLGKEQYDIIFITNPTIFHYDTIKACVNCTKHMFIEKPVFHDPGVSIDEIPFKSDSVYYVACPLRYTSVLQYIKNNLEFDKVYSVRSISSSYLPEWRKDTDYRYSYSAHRNLGGGVAIDLIHEWDYITYLFGFPEKVLYSGGKFSGLQIDSDDLASYIGVYSDKLIELHLDYFGRISIREMTLFMEDDVIRADLLNSCIVFEKNNKVVDFNEERNTYQCRELEHFFDIIDGKCVNDNNIKNAIKVLSLTKGEHS